MFNNSDNMGFKNGDFKNHILNEKNVYITENFINKIFKKYSVDHKVQNLQNFQIAFTHVSYLKKSAIKEKTAQILKNIVPISDEEKRKVMPLQQRDYNTFEYQGDAVIHLALTKYLYFRYSNEDVGFLTKLRTNLEKADSLSELSKILGFDKYVIIARNMEYNNARDNDVHLTEDIFESFICALFIETNFAVCNKFIISLIEEEKDFAKLISHNENYKDIIMQYFHAMKWPDPKYIESSLSRKNNLDISNQVYVIYVQNHNLDIVGVGKGNTRGRAEQDAAHDALIKLGVLKDADEVVSYYGINNISVPPVKKDNDHSNDYSNDYYEYNSDSDKIDHSIWFKDGDYLNHMLNEKNMFIDEMVINKILKEYGLDYKIKNLANFLVSTIHISYLEKTILKEKTAILLKDIPPINAIDRENAIPLQKKDYSRLSHLGNAVVHLALTQYLSARYPLKDQGFLTKLRTKIERAEKISILAVSLGLEKYAIIAKNMELNNARTTDISLMKSLFEAFIGSLFLEIDYEICKVYLINIIEKELDFADLLGTEDNYKDKINHYFHKCGWKDPKYGDVSCNTEKKIFSVCVMNQKNDILGVGQGNTKLKAEQDAAYNALIKLNALNDTYNNENDFFGEMSDDENEEKTKKR